ncbi:MAG: VWA domain-containing protein [Nitrospinae bacterium]|nr:VWA domain-containing protein [Nitrospinota bacterium]
MTLAYPWTLALLALLPLWIWWRHRRRPELRRALRYSSTVMFTRLLYYREPVAAHLPFALRLLAVAALILALARPQTGVTQVEIISEGIDIMLILDISSSMSATDLEPNRLEAAKAVLGKFIEGRVNDRIGLVIFSAQAFTQCPLTLDYGALRAFLDRARIGLVDDGTAIGMALAAGAARLDKSGAKSRVAVLLTDGVNNRGAIDPLTAARVAAAAGVKVYTIGVGKEGMFYQTALHPGGAPRQVLVQTEIDETLLRQIASLTGGAYFRAEDETALLDIYRQIDKMEKTDVKTKVYTRYTDWFTWPLVAALILALLEFMLPATPLRVAP